MPLMNPIVRELKKNVAPWSYAPRDQSRRSADYIFGKWHVRRVGGPRSVRQRGRIGTAVLVKAIYRPFLSLCLTYACRCASSATAQVRAQKCVRAICADRSCVPAVLRVHRYIHVGYVVARNPFCTVNKTSNNSLGTSNICPSVRTSVKSRGAVKKKKDHCIYIYAILLIDSCLFSVKYHVIFFCSFRIMRVYHFSISNILVRDAPTCKL